MAEHRFVEILRRGKYLQLQLDDALVLTINAMLTGRFHWVEAETKKPEQLAMVLGFDDGHEPRYSDMRRMGRFHLTEADQVDAIPQLGEMGPDVMAIDEAQFMALIAKRRGQIKNTLTNQEFVAGIGNVYSDKILWEAKLHTHRKCNTMDDDDIHRLLEATRSVLERSSAAVSSIAQSEGIDRKEGMT